MALVVADLIYPRGELLPSMFPDNDIHAAVGTWLHESVGLTGDEVAQAAWIYYRAYNAVANRIAATPNNENSFGTHSVSWGQDRIAQFRKMADDQLALYSRLTGVVVATSIKPASFRVY